jgi:predicted nucleic acid-binding protein
MPAANALVVDASVATKWYLTDEAHADRALKLLTRFVHGEIDLLAPAQIRYEVPSAITTATSGRRPRFPVEVGRQLIETFLTLGLPTVDDDAIIYNAYELAQHHSIAFYDALYLAVAERLKLPFVTADSKLYERIGKLPYVQWIEEFA